MLVVSNKGERKLNKKVILGTLLASTTLCAMSTQADAATSGIKAESKKITVTSKSAKLFKDASFKQYKKSKQGAVYQVNGYRNVHGKHYYRLYQKNSKGKMSYRGYMYSGYAKTLKQTNIKTTKYIAKKKSTLWNDLYFAKKKTTLNSEKVYFTKGYYKLGNGKKYYSIYQKDSKNKNKWCGYTYSGNLKSLTMKKDVKKVTMTKNYSSWNDLYFAKKKKNYDYKKGIVFETKGYYTIDGKKFYSVNQKDAKGKTVWKGYMNSTAFRDLKAEKLSGRFKLVTPNKYDTDKCELIGKSYKDLYFNNGRLLDKDTNYGWSEDHYGVFLGSYIDPLYATNRYTLGNGKKYLSIYKSDEVNKWIGYTSQDNIRFATEEEFNNIIGFKNKFDKANKIIQYFYDKGLCDQEGRPTDAFSKQIDKLKDEFEKTLNGEPTDPEYVDGNWYTDTESIQNKVNKILEKYHLPANCVKFEQWEEEFHDEGNSYKLPVNEFKVQGQSLDDSFKIINDNAEKQLKLIDWLEQ